MIWILVKGLAVGLAVAAPVGPIALLCIKRTLDRGWAFGFASGLGVAAADASYGLMVAAGLSATGLLLAYTIPMQLSGGLLIAALGARSILSGLAGRAGRVAQSTSRGGLVASFASAWVLTMANPTTILAFAGLVAGLGASAAARPGAAYVLVLGVFLGSLAWWIGLTGTVALARSRITASVTRGLDVASGAVLLLWGLWLAWRALAG